MQEWKHRHDPAGVENAGVEISGVVLSEIALSDNVKYNQYTHGQSSELQTEYTRIATD